MSEDEYLEFAQPYLKSIFDYFSFRSRCFTTTTSATGIRPSPYGGLGVNIFNFSHLADIKEARTRLGPKVCMLGNVPGLDVLTKGSPEAVSAAVKACLDNYGSKSGLILSAGGGASPGMPKENVQALMRALKEWNISN